MQTITQQGLKGRIYAFLKTQKEAVTKEALMNQPEIGSAGLETVQEALQELVEERLALTTVLGYFAETNTGYNPRRSLRRGMKEVRGTLAFVFVLLLGSLYTTFVLTKLWNWFATVALHLSEISFWVMYGLVLIVGLFGANYNDGNIEQKYTFKAIATAVDACVPDDKRQSVREQLGDQEQGIWDDILLAFAKILIATVALVIGWAIHTFLL
jgi:hypothetical protein